MGGKGKSAGSLDESEANGPENASVRGFGLCSFGNQCGDQEWTNCRKVSFTLHSGAVVSAALESLGEDYRGTEIVQDSYGRTRTR